MLIGWGEQKLKTAVVVASGWWWWWCRTCLAILKYFGSDIYFIVGIDTCAFNSVASSARHSSVIVFIFKLKLKFNNTKIVYLELGVEVNAGLAIEIVTRSNV